MSLTKYLFVAVFISVIGCAEFLKENIPLSFNDVNKHILRHIKPPKFSKPESELVMISTLSRHGDRAPDTEELEMFPNEPDRNYSFYPMGPGGLTNGGKLRLYNMGVALRQRYNRFLGDILTPDLLDMRTTDYGRTKSSGMMLLAGMWPPQNEQRWADKKTCKKSSTEECHSTNSACRLAMDWQPIPYSYEDLLEDDLTGHCTNMYTERNINAKKPEFQSRLTKAKQFMEYLSEQTGSHINRTSQVWYFDNLQRAKEAVGLKIQKWVAQAWPKIQELTNLEFEIQVASTISKQLSGGPIANKILQDCLSKSQGTLEPPERKVFMYAAHENSVSGLLAALGGKNGLLYENGQKLPIEQPVYGSTVVVELHKSPSSKQHYIKILYYNQKEEKPVPLKISGCDMLCPIEEALSLTKDVRISKEEYYKLCGGTEDTWVK